MRGLFAVLMAMLVAVPAFAGVTKYSTTVVPLPNACDQTPFCAAGACSSGLGACTTNADCQVCTATGGFCADNADCGNPVLSSASKVQVTGTGLVKLSIKGVTGPGGVAATTDGILGTSDDYIAKVTLLNIAGKPKLAYVKLDLKDGKGKASADAAGVLPVDGTFMLPFLEILGPPTDPASCPGGNEPADIVARATAGNCGSGRRIGAGGFLATNAKTKLSASIAPRTSQCVNYQTCVAGACNSTGLSCSTDLDCQTCSGATMSCDTNADCNVGVPSAASKFQMNGAGDFKLSLTGARDATGQPLTTDQTLGSPDDFVVALFLANVPSLATSHSVYFKTDYKDGKARLEGNVASVLPAASTPFAVFGGLSGPPLVPANCAGANSEADIAARLDDNDCGSGLLVGVSGVLSGH